MKLYISLPSMLMACLSQWRNQLARGTYTAVHVRYAEVVCSSLAWDGVFHKLCYICMHFLNENSYKLLLLGVEIFLF